MALTVISTPNCCTPGVDGKLFGPVIANVGLFTERKKSNLIT